MKFSNSSLLLKLDIRVVRHVQNKYRFKTRSRFVYQMRHDAINHCEHSSLLNVGSHWTRRYNHNTYERFQETPALYESKYVSAHYHCSSFWHFQVAKYMLVVLNLCVSSAMELHPIHQSKHISEQFGQMSVLILMTHYISKHSHIYNKQNSVLPVVSPKRSS
jgi:hypothetical protein